MTDILATRACRNEFLDSAGPSISERGLRRIVEEWFPVTFAFCTGVVRYAGLLSDRVYHGDPEARDQSEAALLMPLEVATAEFGFGQYGPLGIHYRMFARLGEPLGLGMEDLLANRRGHLPETANLVDTIRGSFDSFVPGAACLRVVEGSAFTIVDMMDRVFTHQAAVDGGPRFSDYQLEYIKLHIVLEKEHDIQSENFYSELVNSSQDGAELDREVVRISESFGKYWDALARDVLIET